MYTLWTVMLALGRVATPPPPPSPRFFEFLFLGDKTYSAPDVFSSYSFIPITHFETTLVMVSCYAFELLQHLKNSGGGS